MAYAIGDISGCHINPAVFLAMLITKRINITDLIGNVIAQFATNSFYRGMTEWVFL